MGFWLGAKRRTRGLNEVIKREKKKSEMKIRKEYNVHKSINHVMIKKNYRRGGSACRPLQMPLVESVVLSMIRRLRGWIFAPDESRRSCTLFWMPLTWSELRGMTLSLLLTLEKQMRRVFFGK